MGKIERKFAWWKKLYFSKGCRLTLLKSALSSLPTYYLSHFTIPTHVANKIEKMHKDFLWGGMGGESKSRLVGCDKVCVPMANGGLGIRKPTIFNKALLGKRLWHFGAEGTWFWRSVAATRFGEERGGWTSKLGRGIHGCGLCRGIRMGWEAFSRNTQFGLGWGIE